MTNAVKCPIAAYVQMAPTSNGNYLRYARNVCPPPSNFRALGARRDWLNFFWEIWNTPNTTTRYSVVDINAIWRETTWSDPKETERKTHAWCLPVTTAQSGENGWTCKRYPWSHRDSENWGVYLGFVDDKAAVKHHVGKPWEDLVVTANYKYNIVGKETFNRDKFFLFRDGGRKAGVTY